MLITQKYKPKTQKALFHKDLVNHIRKWIKMIEDSADRNESVRQILFLYGPIGCSKTVTVECLFKSYNLYNVDSDNLRSSDKIDEIIQSTVGFRAVTLANIDKWNHKNKRDRSNIIFIDNLELCDRGIESFIDTLHNKHNTDIPVILVSNSIKHKDIFANYSNCTFLEFRRPSLLDLTKLANEIVTGEDLKLSREQILRLIERSESDVRQLLFLLDQWSVGKSMNHNFDNFIESIQIKYTDKDLSERLEYVFNHKRKFHVGDLFLTGSIEPQVLSNGIYQNYLNTPPNTDLTVTEQIDLLKNYSNVADQLSYANIIHNEIYENQNWNLYNDYTFYSTVMPSYYIKHNDEILYNNFIKANTQNKVELEQVELEQVELEQVELEQVELEQDKILSNMKIIEWVNRAYEFTPFKDISYNFLNSYQEVKRITSNNMYCKVLNPITYSGVFGKDTLADSESLFTIVDILLKCIQNLNVYFNTNKRGKNTTKKEKLDLCDNIGTDPVKASLDFLVNTIYRYKLFEIDTDDFIMNYQKYKDDKSIKTDVNKIDLRVFKRILNIFTMDEKHKLFKSHIETSVQYKILQRLVQEYTDTQPERVSKNINTILTEDLDKIWNF